MAIGDKNRREVGRREEAEAKPQNAGGQSRSDETLPCDTPREQEVHCPPDEQRARHETRQVESRRSAVVLEGAANRAVEGEKRYQDHDPGDAAWEIAPAAGLLS